MTTALELWDKLRQTPHVWIPTGQVFAFVLTPNERDTVLQALRSAPAEVAPTTNNGWALQPDIPNIDAMSVFHRELHKMLVTRLPDGTWWVHAPIGAPVSPRGQLGCPNYLPGKNDFCTQCGETRFNHSNQYPPQPDALK